MKVKLRRRLLLPVDVYENYRKFNISHSSTATLRIELGALTALFFSNYCVGLKSDSEITQLAVIRQLRQPVILSALSLIRLSHHLQP